MAKWGQFLRRRKKSKRDAGQTQETQSSTAYGELGRLLRETREERGISLDEIEEHTRIRSKYVLALEEGRYDELPTPGHIHGFLRNYALSLGLDMEEVEALYAKDRAAHRRFEPRIFHPKNIALIPKKPLVRADLTLSVVIVLVLAVAGWVAYQFGLPLIRPQPTPTATPTATATPQEAAAQATATEVPDPTSTPEAPTATLTEPAATPEPTATQPPTVNAPLVLPTPTPEPTATPTPTPTPTPVEGVTLKIRVVDRVWLQVTVDGEETPGQLLEVDEEREWQGENTIYIICGNAGGIEVTVNGEALGMLGARAEVIEKTWGPEGEVTPIPTPTTTS